MRRLYYKFDFILITILLLKVMFIEVTPVYSARSASVLLLVTDENGRWSPENQKNLFPGEIKIPEEEREKGEAEGLEIQGSGGIEFQIVPPENAFNEKVMAAVSVKDRLEMLSFPEALLSSRRAINIFAVNFVLTIKTQKAGKQWMAEAEIYEIADGETNYIPAKYDSDCRKSINMTLSEVPRALKAMLDILEMPVIGSSVGKIYHVKGSDHITTRGKYQEFNNPKKAQLAGFKPCPICFPGKYSYEKNDTLEAALGRELTHALEYSYLVCEDPELNNWVRSIGEKIVQKNNMKDNIYRFKILDTVLVNAYSVPGGGIYITRGLVETIESDDELAGVISHEIAHINCRHAIKMFRRAQTYSILGTVLVITTGNQWIAALSNFAELFFTSGWSRGFEAEADKQGIIYMSAAEYDPVEYTVLFKKFRDQAKLKRKGPDWFRTHPTDEQRLKEADKSIGSLKELFAAQKELEKFDPEMATFVRTHPVNYLDNMDYLKKFVKIYMSLRLADLKIGETTTEKNANFELVPLEESNKNPVPKSPEGIKPPQSLNKEGNQK